MVQYKQARSILQTQVVNQRSTLDTFYQQAFGQLDSLDMSLSAYTKAVDEIQGDQSLKTLRIAINISFIYKFSNAYRSMTSHL
ncbi:MAG: hypothetical protein MR629_02280 [Helicobacter sp.]|nr:hypothetical protein [Helicobacter sp.]